MTFNRKHKDVYKISHAIIFFLDKEVQSFGITKLMKLFFFADRMHLKKYKKPIFNKSYTKLERGPVPLWILELINSNQDNIDFLDSSEVFNTLIETYKTGYHNMTSFKKRDNVEFNENFFSQSEMEILNKVVSSAKYMNTEKISELSHKTYAWKSVELNQAIEWRSLVDNIEDKKFINYLHNEHLSFRDNLDMFQIERR